MEIDLDSAGELARAERTILERDKTINVLTRANASLKQSNRSSEASIDTYRRLLHSTGPVNLATELADANATIAALREEIAFTRSQLGTIGYLRGALYEDRSTINLQSAAYLDAKTHEAEGWELADEKDKELQAERKRSASLAEDLERTTHERDEKTSHLEAARTLNAFIQGDNERLKASEADARTSEKEALLKTKDWDDLTLERDRLLEENTRLTLALGQSPNQIRDLQAKLAEITEILQIALSERDGLQALLDVGISNHPEYLAIQRLFDGAKAALPERDQLREERGSLVTSIAELEAQNKHLERGVRRLNAQVERLKNKAAGKKEKSIISRILGW